jgi:hypothetical protein
MRRTPALLILLTASVFVAAQEANVQTSKTAAAPKPSVTPPAAKPKLTEQQKRGLNLLESAEASAGELEPASRIVAYTQIARIYQTSNKNKAIDLLQQAYESLRTLQLDSPNKGLNMQLKYQLQQQVLNQFASLAPGKVDGLMDQMEPTVRKEALQVLLPYYEKNKNLDRPVSVLMQLAVEAEMPYEIVNDVMDKLGAAHPDQIRELFLASLNSYQTHEHTGMFPSTDFASLISKAYGKVPDESIETAIDEDLSQAKKADEKNSNVSISMGFEKGAVEFKSIYDTQLFAVLPTLEQVDPDKAKRLSKENEDVNTFASKYPEGMNSLSKDGRPRSIGIHTGNSASPGGQGPNTLEEQRMNGIMNDAADHPNDALANAASLSPRVAVFAYIGIARANVKKNTTAAGIALGKAQELLPKVPLNEQMPTITEMASLYERIGEKESAEKMIELGTKTAAEVFKQESDADDPNLAPKAYWVSTNAWRNLVDTSYKLAPGQAMTLLKEAPDDEMRAFAQIALAKRMMGSTAPAMDWSMTANKNGMMMTSLRSSEGEEADNSAVLP